MKRWLTKLLRNETQNEKIGLHDVATQRNSGKGRDCIKFAMLQTFCKFTKKTFGENHYWTLLLKAYLRKFYLIPHPQRKRIFMGEHLLLIIFLTKFEHILRT
jgi:hypothetical protein